MKLPPLIDLHEDISLYYTMGGIGLKFRPSDFSEDVPGNHGGIPKFKKANVKLIFSSIAPLVATLDEYRTTQLSRSYGYALAMRVRSAPLMALEHIKTYHNLIRKHKGQLSHITHKSDLDHILSGRKIGFLIAMEGAEALEDVEDLELFYRLGLRSLQLTWSFDNKYSATSASAKDYGLTGDGEELVRLCNRLGVVVDLAHASKKAVMEACKISRLPLIVSHANSMSVFRHPRNVDDEEIDAIKRARGVVGMTFVGPFISKKPSFKGLADHVMYLYEKFGPDVLAIGTDFYGLINIDEPEGLEDITKVGNLWNELLDRGLKQGDLEKITYTNALRVIKANAPKWEK
jgi:membrane dipeptidase